MSRKRRQPKQLVPHKGRATARHGGARQVPFPHEHAAMAAPRRGRGQQVPSDHDADDMGQNFQSGPAGLSIGP